MSGRIHRIPQKLLIDVASGCNVSKTTFPITNSMLLNQYHAGFKFREFATGVPVKPLTADVLKLSRSQYLLVAYCIC